MIVLMIGGYARIEEVRARCVRCPLAFSCRFSSGLSPCLCLYSAGRLHRLETDVLQLKLPLVYVPFRAEEKRGENLQIIFRQITEDDFRGRVRNEGSSRDTCKNRTYRLKILTKSIE